MAADKFTASSNVVWRGDRPFQQCATPAGARKLANLLNDVADLHERYGHLITTHRDPGEVMAAALARTFDWCLELPTDREARQENEAATRAYYEASQ